jgi:hypothetical protein
VRVDRLRLPAVGGDRIGHAEVVGVLGLVQHPYNATGTNG